jgi:hypothetical protein
MIFQKFLLIFEQKKTAEKPYMNILTVQFAFVIIRTYDFSEVFTDFWAKKDRSRFHESG